MQTREQKRHKHTVFWPKTNLCNLLWKQCQNAETNFMGHNNRLHSNHKQTQYWLFIFNTTSVASAFQTLQTSVLCQMFWLTFIFILFFINDTWFDILLYRPNVLVAAVSGCVCVCVCICVSVCVCVFIYRWGHKPEYTQTHGDLCHGGDLNWGLHG